MVIKKIPLIVMGIIGSGLMYGEYIVYKKNSMPMPISDKAEYEKVYNVLMSYQWPMVIGYAAQMPKGELDELLAQKPGAEENFIRKKLKQLSSEYDVAFIPTILYELNALQIIYQYKEPTDALGILPGDMAKYRIGNITEFSTREALYNRFREINMAPVVRLFHQKINTKFIQYLNEFEPSVNDLTAIIQRNLQKIIEKITLEIKKDVLDKLRPKSYGSSSGYSYLIDPKIITNFIDEEINANKKNEALLYRGGRATATYIIGTKQQKQPIEIYFLVSAEEGVTFAELQKKYQESRTGKASGSFRFLSWKRPLPYLNTTQPVLASVSYGNSLLAGIINDYGASAAYYLSQERIGYALRIDKNKFLHNTLNALLYYSLFNTSISLFGVGEFFHSRTIAYAPKETREYMLGNPKATILIPGITGDFIDFESAHLILKVGDPLQKAFELSDYIAHHANIIKLQDGTFFPTQKEVASYFQVQNELTDMFKAMINVRRYIYLKKDDISKK